MLSVSERLSSIKLKAPLQFLDGSFLFHPTYSLKVCRFLYYFCLCKSFKELFLFCLHLTCSKSKIRCARHCSSELGTALTCMIFLKAGAKVQTFSEPPKLFRRNFHLLCKILATLDEYQDTKQATPY